MRVKISEKAEAKNHHKVEFVRRASKLFMTKADLLTLDSKPVVALIRNPGKRGEYRSLNFPRQGYDHVYFKNCSADFLRDPINYIHIGFPQLPAVPSGSSGPAVFFHIIRSWLKDCDSHEGCRRLYNTELPTRLIYVGTNEGDTIRLCEPKEENQVHDFSYIALSHAWGENNYTRFITKDQADLDKFKQGIVFNKLPRTFRDAIVTTRALKKRYLWIDSLCILQNDQEDKKIEIPRMDVVYSSAYCVIAASRAADQRTGFLLKRDPRLFIHFPETDIYACEDIDDFRCHVLKSGLNSRAWVLQERALARRTVYFTEKQTYFECGEGIRCETLGKIKQSVISITL
jgi:hypothetical protein